MPGIVSYTHRNSFQKDVASTLEAIKSLGVRDVEFSNLFGRTASDIRKLLDERGMFCSSFGVSYDDAVNKTDEVAANALKLRASFGRVAWIPHQPPFDLSHARKAVQDFNRVGKILKDRYGLIFCYHNHGYEFYPHDDGTLFDSGVNSVSRIAAFPNRETDRMPGIYADENGAFIRNAWVKFGYDVFTFPRNKGYNESFRHDAVLCSSQQTILLFHFQKHGKRWTEDIS